MRAGMSLTRRYGCESIMLAGTDLALVFGKGVESGFNVLDCAEVHAVAIAKAAMTTRDGSGSPAHASPNAFSRR